MRALWSRAAQVPGTCRCTLCVSKATAIADHQGLGSLGSSWAFRTSTSTFFYTTIFAAGLTTDTKTELARNKQWEEAFAQLRDALEHPPGKARASDQTDEPEYVGEANGSPTVDDLVNESEWDMARRFTSMDVNDDVTKQIRDAPQLDDAAHNWHVLHLDSRMPGAQALAWPANTGRDLVPHNLPPQSLWAPDALRWTALRRRQTRKKLAMQELSTGLLVHRLIRHVDLARFFKSEYSLIKNLSPTVRDTAALGDNEAERAHTDFLMDIERLHVTDVANTAEEIAKQRIHVGYQGVPGYIQDADGDFYAIAKQMNEGIAQLLRQCKNRNEREMAIVVAKICHNLLVSTAAPDLQTFNILLSGFIQWRRPTLVDDVISAFYTCKIRPNELLCKQILDYYAVESRPDDFSRFVARMRGVGDAISLANPTISINEASEGRLTRVNENKVYQKIHPTPMVFAALIDGVVKFAGFDRALDVYYEMKADGWGLAIPTLTRLLGDCIRRADWEGGTYIWEEINRIKVKAKPSYVAKAYQHMLSLCSVTGNTVAFNQILNEVTRRGFDQKAILKAAMQTNVWAQHKRDNLAPAWAADNVMIAVSGYLNDTTTPSDTSSERHPAEIEYGDEPFNQNLGASSSDHKTEPNTSLSNKVDIVDPKEAWSSWLEHELGEKPKDPEP
ncbi:hypothetical protein CC86DRAFT_365387 [Ophiobolus disseminans]|uniref:Uncharacterized protein n=1 Tax=Ophiobolus disseminans TaxID=1469910 RepID=A0A6A7ALH1_9PLEO|nr:hypothetical protein CC86DRAFT_365387 [Ophiobolus disseminans]